MCFRGIMSNNENSPTRKMSSRHLRAPVEIRIEVTKGLQATTTTSRNLAIGGISFETIETFAVGDEINVLLYIPSNKDIELLKSTAEIVWIKEDFGAYMIGAAFRKFAPGDQRRLREWLLECVRAQKEGRNYF